MEFRNKKERCEVRATRSEHADMYKYISLALLSLAAGGDRAMWIAGMYVDVHRYSKWTLKPATSFVHCHAILMEPGLSGRKWTHDLALETVDEQVDPGIQDQGPQKCQHNGDYRSIRGRDMYLYMYNCVMKREEKVRRRRLDTKLIRLHNPLCLYACRAPKPRQGRFNQDVGHGHKPLDGLSPGYSGFPSETPVEASKL